MKSIKVIVTGATGMVGEGVAHECLLRPEVTEVLILTRRPSGIENPKVKELIVKDFFDLSSVADQLKGYDACYFCLGVSSVGMKEEQYRHLTYDLTMNLATLLVKQNPSMTFCYVSGAKTDSTERGRQMWARVKGKTENDLFKLGFKQCFAFRPGYMQPTPGLKNTLSLYKYVSWLYMPMRMLFPSSACTLKEVGEAMINVTLKGFPKKILEVLDIVEAAKK